MAAGMKVSKRVRAANEKVNREKHYAVADALSLVKELCSTKFDETVDVAVMLGLNARKSDQNVRGATVLPNGTGKTVRVAVFADGENAQAAKAAGADIVGLEDLAEAVKQGEINFDVCIATPDTMRVVGPLGQILGPRGLMPNPKVGTVTTDVSKAVEDAKSGQVQFRIDKAGVIHCPIGKASFAPNDLEENLNSLVAALIKAKPASAKGQYIRRVSLSSTMGPGVKVERTSISAIR
ncbi:50S ribosomal protein L1 [Candidatus Spongiihabitans sp.]|uniref:50S ribosomal protein L1 n=1 Tax=Candidatus Spongiihabitans sp. TaxID=3101308 RepID=UPI003C7C84AE